MFAKVSVISMATSWSQPKTYFSRLQKYPEALQSCQQQETLVQECYSDDHIVRQELFKNFADIYFNRG